jgi:hypothetical protein
MSVLTGAWGRAARAGRPVAAGITLLKDNLLLDPGQKGGIDPRWPGMDQRSQNMDGKLRYSIISS